jgi:hypothetical protein
LPFFILHLARIQGRLAVRGALSETFPATAGESIFAQSSRRRNRQIGCARHVKSGEQTYESRAGYFRGA